MEHKDQIEAYLMDQMSPNEKVSFAAKVDSDPILKMEVDEMRTLILGIETANLKNKLSSLAQRSSEGKVVDLGMNQTSNESKADQSASRSIGWWAKAASVLLLVGVAGWFLLRGPSASHDLFAQYYYADPGLQTPMSATNNYEFFDAMVDYKSGEYEAAREKWEVQLAAAPENDTINYFLGASYINTENFEAALPYLQVVIDQEESAFNHKSKWYWSLVQLRLRNNSLINEKWRTWKMLEVRNSLYPLEEFWQQIQAE